MVRPERLTILDLCGGTGAWSKPYRDAGYQVVVVDPDAKVEPDVCRTVQGFKQGLGVLWEPTVHGVLASPPCTEFAGSGARWWKSKPPELLDGAISTVRACLHIIQHARPQWWCLENPVGRLARCVPELGSWKHTFHPYDYGDPWMKRTCLWGEGFTMPTKDPVPLPDNPAEAQRIWYMSPGPERARLRSITPSGFAKAFFEANP